MAFTRIDTYHSLVEAERLMKEYILPGFRLEFERYTKRLEELEKREGQHGIDIMTLKEFMKQLQGITGQELIQRFARMVEDTEKKT